MCSKCGNVVDTSFLQASDVISTLWLGGTAMYNAMTANETKVGYLIRVWLSMEPPKWNKKLSPLTRPIPLGAYLRRIRELGGNTIWRAPCGFNMISLNAGLRDATIAVLCFRYYAHIAALGLALPSWWGSIAALKMSSSLSPQKDVLQLYDKVNIRQSTSAC